MKYKEELRNKLQELRHSKIEVEKQMLDLYLKVIRKNEANLPALIKKSLEDALSKNNDLQEWEDKFCISDATFDVLWAAPDENSKLRHKAIQQYLEETLTAMDLTFLKRAVTVERFRKNFFTSMIAKLIGLRTTYCISLWTISLQADLYDDSVQEAAERFIVRIKSGVLKPTEEPGAYFRRTAKENGFTPKQALENIERIHTGQDPKYIKIERKQNGKQSTR